MAKAESLQNSLSGFESPPRLHMGTNRKSFMSPVGDYYTVAPLTMEKAHELSIFGFRRVVIPGHFDSSEAEAFLAGEGVEVVRVDIEENALTTA